MTIDVSTPVSLDEAYRLIEEAGGIVQRDTGDGGAWWTDSDGVRRRRICIGYLPTTPGRIGMSIYNDGSVTTYPTRIYHHPNGGAFPIGGMSLGPGELFPPIEPY